MTTAGEFHSITRQLRRLGEEDVRVSFVAVDDLASLAERLLAEVREDTAAVLVSTVLFESASIVPGLRELADELLGRGVQLLFDAYHAFSVVPFRLAELSPGAFVVAGGYKYAQWGEGCCFMCVPQGCTLRPVNTGWFADFGGLEQTGAAGPVRYGEGGAARFAGSTYDPTSHYRAAAVNALFARENWSVARLRERSLQQTARIIRGLDEGGYPLLTPREPAARAGFVAARVEGAARVAMALREQGVWVDARGEALRFGPAPYTTDEEIDRALAQLRAVHPR